MNKQDIIGLICSCVPSPIDENIPDDDKEEAYKQGYNDCIIDAIGKVRKLSDTWLNVKDHPLTDAEKGKWFWVPIITKEVIAMQFINNCFPEPMFKWGGGTYYSKVYIPIGPAPEAPEVAE